MIWSIEFKKVLWIFKLFYPTLYDHNKVTNFSHGIYKNDSFSIFFVCFATFQKKAVKPNS